jgi:hypothetical protein
MKSPKISARRGQQGNVILSVAVIGLVATILFSNLMTRGMELESVAVERSLAEIRAYWAATGHHQYALSRTRRSELCDELFGCDSNDKFQDTSRVAILQSYLNEISSLRTFTYADEDSDYRITVSPVAAVDDNPLRHTFSGHLMITTSIVDEDSVPILSDFAARAAPLQLRVCVGLGSSSSNCGTISSNNGGLSSHYHSVKRLARQPQS